MAVALQNSNKPAPTFLDILPRDVVIQVFYEVIRQLPDLKDKNTQAYYPVSKKFAILFRQAKFRFLMDILPIQKFQNIPQNTQSIEEKALILEKTIKRGPEPFLNEQIKDLMESNSVDLSFIEALLKAGADPNALSPKGAFPLWMVLYYDRFSNTDLKLKLVEMLLNYGANPNGSSTKSLLLLILEEKPCELPRRDYQFKLIRLLCEKGANPYKIFPSSAMSAYDYAQKYYPLAWQLFKEITIQS